MSSSGITSINELPLFNNQNQNGHIQQQQMMSQQPQNVVLNRNEIVSTNNNQMSTTSYTQLLPTSGGSTMSNPLTMENSQQSQQSQQSQPNYNELISQLQKAAAYGTTALPSRDIPMEPLKVANDVQSQPNYIPPPQFQEDYIKNSITPQNLADTNSRQIKSGAYFDKLYGELQLPIIIALLFFLFQLPLVKQYNKKLLPFLFKSDGNPNLYGYIANSVLFASMIYVLLKLVAYLA